MKNNVIILKSILESFHEKYKNISFTCVYDKKIDYLFVLIENESEYTSDMQYYDDLFIMNEKIFNDLKYQDILISDDPIPMKLEQNETLFKIN